MSPQTKTMTLVFIPYHDEKRYCLNHLLDWLTRADLPDCEIVFRMDRERHNENQSIKKQREFARQLAVNREATHLLYIDADTIPPLDVLPKLLAHDLPVIGALYYGRKNNGGKTKRAVAWIQGDDDQTFLEKELTEVDGMGLGCTLLNREAFTSFNFNDWGGPSDDYEAFDRLRQNGFKVMLDTSLICRHYATESTYN